MNDFIIAIDVGTAQTAYTVMNKEYRIIESDIVPNETLLDIIKQNRQDVKTLVYEEFASYGMPIGKTTMESIKWNGRFIQHALHHGYCHIVPMLRKDVKMNLCQTMKAKDSNIRIALVDRYATHDFKNGKGTKNNPDTLYGFRADMYSSLAIGTTYYDKVKGKYK